MSGARNITVLVDSNGYSTQAETHTVFLDVVIYALLFGGWHTNTKS